MPHPPDGHDDYLALELIKIQQKKPIMNIEKIDAKAL